MNRKPALKGLSRSPFCLKPVNDTKCRRLMAHKGDCRPNLAAPKVLKAAKSPLIVYTNEVGGFVVTVFSDGTVSSTPVGGGRKVVGKPGNAASQRRLAAKVLPAKARPSKKATCRVSKRGVRCSGPLGHKAAGKRHSFAGLVTIVPQADARRQVAASPKVTKTVRHHVSGRPSARLA